MTIEEIQQILGQVAQQQQTAQSQLEVIQHQVDSNARAIAANSAAIAELRITAQQTVADTAQWFTGVVTNMEEMQSEVREMQAEVREMQSQVRGLQTENRRILERLESREQ